MSKEYQNRRRTSKVLRQELKELDYLDKLSDDERDFIKQFMYEYYQADFNFTDPIHKTAIHVKDCRDRNNASKRQLHSVGPEIRRQHDSSETE